MSTPLRPQASVLLRVWRDQPGRFFFISTKDRTGKWKDHPFPKNKLHEVQGFLERNGDKDLYFCPHGYDRPRRIKGNAAIPKLLWADLDSSDPREMPEFMPSIAIESSPGRFVGLWRLSSFMSENLNRRLTYHLKADPGGWDIGQVLRIPGTLNHKYDSHPRVRLLWADGPEHDPEELERKLPVERTRKTEDDTARDIFRKYERHFSGWIRRQLMRGKPERGKRSEVFWRLVNEIVEAGCSADEAFELLRVSPWNKFVTRANGDDQLRREIDKATSQHLLVEDDESPRSKKREPLETDEGDDSDDDEPYRFLSRSHGQVEREVLDWVWYPYLAKGELSILEGDPGLGKSYMAQMVSAAICDGKMLPSVRPLPKPCVGKVAYFDLENSAGTVSKPRMLDNGFRHVERFFQEEEPFTLDDETAFEGVHEALDKLRPTLVVFDTLATYMGSADGNNSIETMATFRKFRDIAKRYKCAVLVLRHLTKSSKERAIYRGQGSIAFSGLARIVMTIGRMPDDPELIGMGVTKINVAKYPKVLTFKIFSDPSLADPDRSKFEWGEFAVASVEDLLSPTAPKDEALEECRVWLADTLSDGGVKPGACRSMGEARSFNAKLVERAARALGVVVVDGRWTMPSKDN